MRTRALTEGAMLAAITVLFALIGAYVGFITIIIPVPLGLLVYRHGLRNGIIVSLTSAFLAALTLSSVFVAIELVTIGVLGVALGIALREKFGFVQLVIVGVGASIVATLMQIFAYSLIFGHNLFEMYLEVWEQSSEHWFSVWEGLGLSEEMLAQYELVLGAIPETLRLLFPIILVGMGLMRTMANLFVMRIVLKRLGETLPWFPPFAQWRWPWYFVYGFILGRLFSIIALYVPGNIWQLVGFNLDVFFLYAFFIQGLAITWFYMEKYKIHKIVRVILILFLFQPGSILLLFIALAGILDTWFNFRKLKTDKDDMEV